MASLTIVAGCPGTGKTTLASQLSTASPRGLHLVADMFYDFIEEVISPILPESHAQNTTVTIATARAAATFASRGGYDVFIDGVVTSLETFAEVERRRAAGEFRLDLTESLEA